MSESKTNQRSEQQQQHLATPVEKKNNCKFTLNNFVVFVYTNKHTYINNFFLFRFNLFQIYIKFVANLLTT